MRVLIKKMNFLNWLGLYQDDLDVRYGQGMRFERLDLSNRCDDPMPHRIQVTYKCSQLNRTISGYGESTREMFAYEKAICELFEREALYRTGTALGLTTTNGIAAHRILPLAKLTAQRELVERDAFLRHWLTRTPMLKVGLAADKLSSKFAAAIRSGGYDLFMCDTYLGAAPTSIAVVVNPTTGGFMIGSSAAPGLVNRQKKALGEVFIGLFSDIDLSIDPSFRQFKDHSNYWFFKRQMPSWLVGDCRAEMTRPEMPKFRYHILAKNPVPVVSAVSDELLTLWTGITPDAVVKRCEAIYQMSINTDIHPFP